MSAVLSVAVWLAILSGLWPQPGHLAGTAWHAHEMLFGYLAAVIAGFLLTAVRNWTGMPTAIGSIPEWVSATCCKRSGCSPLSLVNPACESPHKPPPSGGGS
ncbi:NnrS family protein [Allochromatium tepidum]|uniref:NnrS family protein n=1 Tax=Allochromatium tepidum TaxID=553982 RepID=UPI001F251E55|nr:NnrS family protein [Allochromatium tepidum]